MRKLGLAATSLVLLILAQAIGLKPALAQEPTVFLGVESLTLKSKSTDNIYVSNYLAVVAFGYGISRSSTDTSTLTKTSSSTNFSVVNVLKEVDPVFSPWLAMSAVSGGIWDEARIEIYDPPYSPLVGAPCNEYQFQLVLNRVFVQSVSTSASSSGEPTEDVEFAFESLQVVFPNG